MGKETLFQKLINEENFENDFQNQGLRYSKNLKILIIALTIVLITVFFLFQFNMQNSNSTQYDIEKGYVWQGPDLVAETSFPIYKDKILYNQQIQKKLDQVKRVFLYDENVENLALDHINTITEQLPNINDGTNNFFVEFPDNIIKDYQELSSSEQRQKARNIDRVLTRFIKRVYNNGFINIATEKLENKDISVRVSSNEEYILKNDFIYDRSKFLEEAEKTINANLKGVSQDIALEIINNLDSPNLIFNEELTAEKREMARNSVSKTLGIVKKGEVIVEKGQKVGSDEQMKIESYKRSKILRSESQFSWTYLLGSIGLSAILFGILLIYLFVMRKKIFYDNLQLTIISVLLVLTAALSLLSVEINIGYPVEYLILIPAFSMLVAVVFDSRTAFYMTVTMSLLMAGIRGNDFVTGTSMIVTGTLAAYTVKDIQNRTQMFQSMFYIFIGLAISILIFGALKANDLSLITQQLSMALINSAISPLITFGSIIIIERFTSITTDLKIKEFDNLDHTLLQKLNDVAPGTYQHSLGVATLAERCAKRVNGNPLLVKVGAYFHDIGKMVKPEYFTENQINMENKHDLLPPKKSAQIIRSHVTDGIEMAKQYKLPQRLIDFIVTHHGTTLIKHFYAKALEESDGIEINEEDFRYPGPRPRSLEEAIVLICDSAEAIARVVANNEDEVAGILEQHLRERILDGQFDQCSITMEQIQIVQETIMKNLKGVSHHRVAYKQIPKDKVVNK